jgi:hypothetical protein
MRSSGGELRGPRTQSERGWFAAVRTKIPHFVRNDKSKSLLGEEVIERFYGGEFVFFDVEDGVELGNLKDIGNLLGEAEELEFAAGVTDGGEAANQFSHSGGIDVIDVGEVEDDLFLAGSQELTNCIAELAGFIAEGDASVDVNDSDVADFARSDGHRVGVRLRASGNVREVGFASQWVERSRAE